MNMDKMVGPDFEAGLQTLKLKATEEAQKAVPPPAEAPADSSANPNKSWYPFNKFAFGLPHTKLLLLPLRWYKILIWKFT